MMVEQSESVTLLAFEAIEKELSTGFRIGHWIDWKHCVCLGRPLSTALSVVAVRILKRILSIDSLVSMWTNAFASINGDEFNSYLLDINGFINGYRFISNNLNGAVDISDVQDETYTGYFVQSLLQMCIQSPSMPSRFVAEVVSLVNDQFLTILLSKIVRNGSDTNKLLCLCSSQSTLHMSLLLFKLAQKDLSMLNESKFSTTIQFLLNSALKVYSSSEILNAVYFKVRWSSVGYNDIMIRFGDLIGLSLAGSIIEVAMHTALLWSEKAFVDKKSLYLKSLLSHTLICCLRQLSCEEVLSNGINGVSICSLISAGVSTYLDFSDRETRILGMKVATALSEVLGNKIQFEELQKLENIPSSSSGSSARSRGDSVAKAKELYSKNNFSGNDGESDSDSDLEPFSFEPVMKSDMELQTNYLTVCLNLLRTGEDKPEAAKKHLAALERVPAIMRNDVLPYDSKDLCIPLLNELLILVNHFNQEGFEVKRQEAIISLLVAHPSLAIPVITKNISSPDCPLGLRILCLSLLCDAAKELRGGSANEAPDEVSAQGVMVSLDQRQKTTISHPKRLQLQSSRVKVHRNSFAKVSHLFFLPLANLLANSSSYDPVGVDAVLPSKVFCALSAVMQCSSNTIFERRYAYEALRIALLYHSGNDLELRRSLLTTAFTAVHCLTRSQRSKKPVGSSALSVLTSIAHLQLDDSDDESNQSLMDESELILVMQLSEWAAATLRSDADDQSRAIKQLILQSVSSAMQLKT